MTLLAIMSIVLALCGATVAGIKECRAALTTSVDDLKSAAKEAFKSIDNSAGVNAQQKCVVDNKRINKKTVHLEASSQKKKFDDSYWWYEKTIWVPIIVLLLVACTLTIRLCAITSDGFQHEIISPSPTEIGLIRIGLALAFLLNIAASLWMKRSYGKMKSTVNLLSTTVNTLDAGSAGDQGGSGITRVEPDAPPDVNPKSDTIDPPQINI
jgi:hypothetical protein